MRLAIIPARGGSKRIPRKNIKNFYGRPIIAYAIEAAQASECFHKIVVSTDDPEIATIALNESWFTSGGWLPRPVGISVHIRSAKNSSDTAGTVPVLLECLEQVPDRIDIEDVCCIYPCNPFLTGEKIRKGFVEHLGMRADSTFPVVQYSYPPQRALKISNGMAEMIQPEHYPTRSQDLAPIYHDAGQFYWLNVRELQKQQKLFMERSVPLIYPETEVQDIDTFQDWTLAEVKYQLWRNTQSSLSEQAPKAQAAL